MWEYLVKRIKVLSPRKESAGLHAPHNLTPTSSSRRVEKTGAKEGESRHRRLKKRRELICPVCGIPMEVRAIGKVDVDQCPNCDGIFLDRGELQALSGMTFSTYTRRSKSKRSSHDDSVLIYTPHGLSDHIRQTENE